MMLGSTLLLPASGCRVTMGAIRSVVKDPKVRIKQMNIKQVKLDALDVDFLTDVENENRFPILLKDIDFALDVEERRVAEGKTANGIDLPAGGTNEVLFPVSFRLGESLEVLQKLWALDEFAYKLSAGFHFGMKQASVRIPAEFPGKAPVPKPPVVEIRQMVLTGMGPTGLDGRVTARVFNPNTIDLPLDALDVEVLVSDRTALNTRPLETTVLMAKKAKTVRLNFHIDLIALGMSLAELVTRSQLPYKVKWNLMSGMLPVPFEHTGMLSLRT